MKIQISLSAPKFTEAQENIIWTLMHDKGHVLAPNRKNRSLDGLIAKYGTTPDKVLYRGLYSEEADGILRQMEKQGYVALNKYLSFSENPVVAEKFAARSKTNTILEIPATGPSNKRKAFCYHKAARDLIMAADLDAEFGGDIEERDYTIELLDLELEWIYEYQFKFKVVRSRTEGKYQVLTISPE